MQLIHKLTSLALAGLLLLCLAGCKDSSSIPALSGGQEYVPEQDSPSSEASSQPQPSDAQIYLYGEVHGKEAILEREFELWYEHYHSGGLRHLFVELPYYTAEFLNLWIQADTDDILLALYDDSQGTQDHVSAVNEFYRSIKRDCPDTVFHGTDVGHQYDTTGQRYLEYLEAEGLAGSEQYDLAEKAIEQGLRYYEKADDVFRENTMTKNFIRAFEALGGESVMGIYGAAHTGLDAMDFSGKVACMGKKLKERYGDKVSSEDLTALALHTEPLRADTLELAGKVYEAAYFGEMNMYFNDNTTWEYWRLEDAYEDFKDMPAAGGVLPYDHYPMQIGPGEVFVIDMHKVDGSTVRRYHRSDGGSYEGEPVTSGFLPD